MPTEGNCASVEKAQNTKVGEFDKCEKEKKMKNRQSLAHFGIIASLFKKEGGGSGRVGDFTHRLAHAWTDMMGHAQTLQ